MAKKIFSFLNESVFVSYMSLLKNKKVYNMFIYKQ